MDGAVTADNKTSIDVALDYAEMGWKVLPVHHLILGRCACGHAGCHHPAKHPATPSGYKDATSDPDRLRELFYHPELNIGVCCGAVSGLVVLDIDTRHDGHLSLAQLITHHGDLPETVHCLTGGGGHHYYFRYRTGIPTRTAVRPGIDICSDGRMVVAPPSVHISGHNYRWEDGHGPGEIDLAEFPDWLAELASSNARKPEPSTSEQPAQGATSLSDSEYRSLDRAASGYLNGCEPASEGDRNNSAFRIAGHLFSFRIRDTDKRLPEDRVLELLLTWNQRNDTPLSEQEVRSTVRSAAVGNGEPREVKWVDPDDELNESGLLDSNLKSNALVDLARDHATLFYDPTAGRGYAIVTVNGHQENYGLDRSDFREWIQQMCWTRFRQVPTKQIVSSAVDSLSGIAKFDGKHHRVWTRMGFHENRIYIDLGDADWKVVEIDTSGYRVLDESPVKFVRTRALMPMACPAEDGDINLLRRLISIQSEQHWTLLLAWLVSCFMPDGAYPLLIISGVQGASKSSLTRTLQTLVDPSQGGLSAAPRNEEDLMIAAQHNHLLAFDNLKSVSGPLSDALCRMATGGGMKRRQLYTDNEQVILEAKRPVILNGINEVATAPDLLDRGILLDLPAMDPSQRRSERDLQQEQRRLLPRVLGGLYRGVSLALRDHHTISLDRPPRMVDFARWAMAAMPAFGLTPEDFINAYQGQCQHADTLSLESTSLGSALLSFLPGNNGWEGTPTELLHALRSISRSDGHHLRTDFPGNPISLGKQLKPLTPSLQRLGYHITPQRETSRSRTRRYRITHLTSPEPAPEDRQSMAILARVPESPSPAEHVRATSPSDDAPAPLPQPSSLQATQDQEA